MIDKNTLEIKQDEEKTVYKDLQDIAEDLPDHSPRFVLLSYPMTLVSGAKPPGCEEMEQRNKNSWLTSEYLQPSGRMSVPYVLLYYLPVTCNATLRMLYSSSVELMRNTAEVGKVIEIESADELEDLPKKLGAA